MFQSFFDEVLEPAITRAVTKAVKDTMLQQNTEMIDVKEAARILNVSTRTIFRYCDTGKPETRLPYTLVDGKRLLEKDVVIKYTRKSPAIRVKQSRRK